MPPQTCNCPNYAVRHGRPLLHIVGAPGCVAERHTPEWMRRARERRLPAKVYA